LNAGCHTLLRHKFAVPIAATVRLAYHQGNEIKSIRALEDIMAWTTPTLVEICIGLEINGYLPAEF
jgi:coenzyme PQQ precursor peptide PqqA